MKKLFVFSVVMLFVVFSCTTDTFDSDEGQIVFSKETKNVIHKITESDALDIADKIFEKTRSVSDYTVEYVLNEGNITRSAYVPDTLAYIINFGNDNGFAVVASDNRVFPLLAYSDSGHFKYEKSYDDPVYANFISLLGDYMATIDENDTAVVVPDNYLSMCVVKYPQLKTYNWDQWSPYNKYVVQEYPDCPVGCVAVATGQIMVNCANDLNYHDFAFNFRAIREALGSEASKPDFTNDDDIVSDYPIIWGDTVKYSYDTAIDYVAKLLYWIGKDVGMSYKPTGSGADSNDARELLINLGYTVNESFTNFSPEDMLKRLEEKCLLYTRGTVVNNIVGHAWIIDGYSFCWKDVSEKTDKINICLHCDWGWNGYCNGYYSGEVFETADYSFGQMKYFSVRNSNMITMKPQN